MSLATLGVSDGAPPTPDPVRAAVAEHAYDLAGWHARNLGAKWARLAARAMPGLGLSDAERGALVARYFRLGDEERRLAHQTELASAAAERSARSLDARLDAVRRERMSIRDDVEETIESEISSVARRLGLGAIGEIVLPPLDIRLEATPKALITSPRGKIERLDGALLDPGMSIAEREELENRIERERDISALVVDVGGVATLPASVSSAFDARGVMRTAAHEWVHHWLFFRPLGRDPFATPKLLTLNETVASIVGNEIGDAAYDSLTARMPPAPAPPPTQPQAAPSPSFDFRKEMRETRLEVDRLLAEGDVERAEEYMERRRLLFVDSGYPIRKLNQAYFAFHGAYGESAASVDPIGRQARRLRELSANAGEFLRAVAPAASYEEFLDLLRRAEEAADE